MSSAAHEPTPLRVVIIDDTADLRELLRIALVRGGMAVIGEAGDGLSGIEIVRECRPDLVLLDLSMPVMDGLEALPHLRELIPDGRIIVLSGFGASQMSERAMSIGADGYLQKGASLGRMLDHIRDIVEGRPINPVGHPVALPPVADVAVPGVSSVVSLVPGQLDALALAPFGILEVHSDPPYRIVRSNPAVEAMVDSTIAAGSPLAETDAELAKTMTRNRLRGDADFATTFAGHPVQVTVRHSGTSLLLYLRPVTDEAAKLRTAIATTAHEIRGPVSVLCAVAETIIDASANDLEPAQQTRLMESVQRQARMLDGITADLLTVAQIQRGTLQVDPRNIDPRAIADAVIADRYPSSVSVEVSDDRWVLADPLRLEQMFGNLLSNAHKYGDPAIVLRIRPDPEHPTLLCIDVADEGPGVPADFEPDLFREFSRATGTTAAGTGLGLHVVQTLVRAQGGSVSYTAAPSGGAVFTLTLPATAPG